MGAEAALYSAFGNREMFGRVASQAAGLFNTAPLMELLQNTEDRLMTIYLEWGTYHMRSPHEAWDLAEQNRVLWSGLREAGYRPAGGEVPEGYGWACWNGHTDEMLTALFPLRR